MNTLKLAFLLWFLFPALPLVAQSATGNPVCGITTDGSTKVPSDWATFVAPPKGGSYVDATFGCTITRLTDGSTDFGSTVYGVSPYYATVSSFNANDTFLALLIGNGTWEVVQNVNGANPGHIVLPSIPSRNDSGWLWDASNPNVFYYASGNSLMKATITGTPGCLATENCTATTSVIHAFSEYASGGVNIMDEPDLSEDGTTIPMVGQNANGPIDIFTYNIKTLTKANLYTTTCTASGVTGGTQPGCLHKIQGSGDNRYVMTFTGQGTGAEVGMKYYNGTSWVNIQSTTSHADTGQDLSGNSIYIQQSGPNNGLPGQTDPCTQSGGNGGLSVFLVANPTAAGTCLIDDIHSIPSWHAGYRGGPNQPWVGLSFFDQRGSGPEFFGTSGSYVAPVSSNNCYAGNGWCPYEDELVLARIDANMTSSPASTKVYRLAYARSRSEMSFWAQVNMNCARDAGYCVFNSNMAHGAAGCKGTLHVANECEDAYVVSGPNGTPLFGVTALAPPPSLSGVLQ